MAYHYQSKQAHPRGAHDKRGSYADDDDFPALDSSVLDAEFMQNQDEAHLRKDSFAESHGVMSPLETQVWELQFNNDPFVLEPTSTSGPAPFEDRRDLGPPGAPQGHAFRYPPPPPSWQPNHGSLEGTPAPNVDFIPQGAKFERRPTHGPEHQYPPAPARMIATEGYIPQSDEQTPMSPHSHSDWMHLAQREVQCRPISERIRPQSPKRFSSSLQQQDGIRKKNARVDIPNERNIQAIEDLIDKCEDEDMLKELKQQKRLLRNREAALASRQRKKKHTEDLEGRERDYSRTINGLQNQLENLELQHRNLDQAHQITVHRFQEAQRIIESLSEEKRDLEMKHTEETSTLRKRIQVLTDQLECGPVMSAAPSNMGYSDFSAEMEALDMGSHDWDSLMLGADHNIESAEHFELPRKRETLSVSPTLGHNASATAVVLPHHGKQESPSEPPIASSLLFFLLLCGAFVASRPANSQPEDLPKVPADVRAAAPTVLNDLLSGNHMSLSNFHEPYPSSAEPSQPPSRLPRPTKRSRVSQLDDMHRRLTTPTKQQEIDSAFALTTAQYASMTDMDYALHGDRSASNRPQDSAPLLRHTLGDALHNIQQEHNRDQKGKAAVYTRSLLWEQIPPAVVSQFKEMVKDRHEMEQREKQRLNDANDPFLA